MRTSRDVATDTIAVGIILAGVGVFILIWGWNYVNALCYVGGPCNGLGTTSWVAEDLRIIFTSLGLLTSSFACRFLWVGWKIRDTGPLDTTSILTMVSDPLKAAGAVTLVASFLTSVVVITIPSTPSAWCYGRCIPGDLNAIVILGTFGFALGVVASVFLLRGRYHVSVAVGLGFLITAAALDVVTDIQTWTNSTSVIVSLCVLAVGFVSIGKRRGRSILRTAGVFSLVAATLSFLTALWGFEGYLIPPLDFSGFVHTYGPGEFLVLGVLGMLGFALGLPAGIFTLKRTHHSIIITGLLIMIIAPIIPYVMALMEAIQSRPPCLGPYCYYGTLLGLGYDLFIFAIPTIILSIFAIAFITIHKREFIRTSHSSKPEYSSVAVKSAS